MEQRTLVTDEGGLRRWLDSLRGSRRIIAPRRDGDVVLLKAIGDASEITFDYTITRNSPKETFFPQSEDVVTFQIEGRAVTVAPPASQAEETLLFGIRACDARALAVTDAVFNKLGGQRDGFYAQRRENTVVAVLWCSSMRPWCRCGSFGSPLEGAKAHGDILVTPLDEAFTLDALTEKGGAILSPGEPFSPASEEQVAERDEAHRRIEEQAQSHPAMTPLEQELKELWDTPLWQEMGRRCLGCGICTYLCPACTCFDILDECPGSVGRRYKCWDSCQFSLFTVHSSGHNPRPDQASRVRQRILHKFKFGPQLVGEMGCVGCGRCLELCPMAIRYTDVIEGLRMLEAGAGAAVQEGAD